MNTALSQLIMSTVEYQQWGLNSLTISFCVSLLLAVITAWGILQQNKTIWKNRQAEAVSVVWISYTAILHLVVLTYGIFLSSTALVINGLLALLYVPVLIGLWKFKGFRKLEMATVLGFGLAFALMVLLPYKSSFFFAFAVGGLVAGLAQPLEMWRKKNAQGLNIRLIATILLGNIVWFTYGLAVADWVIVTINLLAFLIFGTTSFLWWKFKNRDLGLNCQEIGHRSK